MTIQDAFFEQSGFYKKLLAYDFSFLEDRFVEKFPRWRDSFPEIQRELKRFFFLTRETDKPLAVLSAKVDELWHLFILHTPQYSQFCNDLFNEFIHHQPHNPRTPVPPEAILNFYDLYPKTFRELPGLWSEDIEEHILAIRQGRCPYELQFQWSGWTGRLRK